MDFRLSWIGTEMLHDRPPVIDVVAEDLMVPSDTPGIDIHVRHKWVAARGPFFPERTVVLVHGATYSSASLFDVPFEGMSFMTTSPRRTRCVRP